MLQLQPHLPEAIAILEKGPNFAVTPKEVPYMKIVQETEKAALSLSSQSMHEQAKNLRQQVGRVLKHSVENPHLNTTNLNPKEKKDFNILKTMIKYEIALARHDKGQGFVTLPSSQLKEKVYASFQNVTSDTPDETNKLKGQI